MNFIEKIYNVDDLKDSDIDEKTTRARAIIINSKNKVLMCYSNKLCHYEFPGGHLEKNESLNNCLIREVKEETGIKIKDKDIIPFYSIKYYCKNYHNTGKNRLVEIYYFIVNSNLEYDNRNRDLDIQEIEEKYECRYISVDSLKDVFVKNKLTTKENNSALDDMILVWDEYIKRRQNNGRL